MAYATTAEFKAYQGIVTPNDDALIGHLLDRATAWLDREANRTLYADSDTTRAHDSHEDTEGMTLYLDGDLAAITTITNGDTVAVSSPEYVTEPRNDTPFYAIKLLSSSGKAWEAAANGDSENAITITGKWSFFATKPATLTHHCIRLASYAYSQKDASTFDVVAVPDAGVIQVPQGFPADVARWVQSVRRLQ